MSSSSRPKNYWIFCVTFFNLFWLPEYFRSSLSYDFLSPTWKYYEIFKGWRLFIGPTVIRNDVFFLVFIREIEARKVKWHDNLRNIFPFFLTLHLPCRKSTFAWYSKWTQTGLKSQTALSFRLHGNLHGDFTAAPFQTIARLYCKCSNDIFKLMQV